MIGLYKPNKNLLEGAIDMNRCRASIHGNYRFFQCSNKAKYTEDGIGYCGIHRPSRLKTRREAQDRKRGHERKVKSAQHNVSEFRDIVVRAAVLFSLGTVNKDYLVQEVAHLNKAESELATLLENGP